MQEVATVVSIVVYALSVLLITVGAGSVKVNGIEVRNPLVRFIVGLFVVPFIAVVFYLFGVVGKFLLLPISVMFGITLW